MGNARGTAWTLVMSPKYTAGTVCDDAGVSQLRTVDSRTYEDANLLRIMWDGKWCHPDNQSSYGEHLGSHLCAHRSSHLSLGALRHMQNNSGLL